VMSGHGGRIEISNRPDGGARVRCFFIDRTGSGGTPTETSFA